DGVGAIKLKGVEFGRKGKSVEFIARGKGQIDVRIDGPDGKLIASTLVDGNTTTKLLSRPTGIRDLVFIMSGETLKVDKWMIK
ncbi:MAG: hypothetical protein MJZ60_06450, partial [Bacteroidaceae bacterium]|nr:hypothetical protein [Bacteroidaceae bacterium]